MCSRAEQAWWDVGPNSQLRTFSGPSPDPFKRDKYGPFRDIPGANHPGVIQPDIMHTYNLGFGKDLAASGIYLVADFFAGRSRQAKLDQAYESFMHWCDRHCKTSSLKDFDLKKTLKMAELLSSLLFGSASEFLKS